MDRSSNRELHPVPFVGRENDSCPSARLLNPSANFLAPAAFSTGLRILRSTNTTAVSTRRGRNWWFFRKPYGRSRGARPNWPRARHPDRRPRRGNRTERRGDPTRRRHRDFLCAHESHSGNRSCKRAGRAAAGRGESGHHAGGARRTVISMRPILPANAPAPSAATWRRTPAVRTRWRTA